MPMDLPPQLPPPPPALIAQASCQPLTDLQAQLAFLRLKARLPSTAFTEARPSEICGLVWVKMARGSVAYTDATGRYLLLALALDTHKGSPADVSTTVETAVAARETRPATPIPGIVAPRD